MTDSYQVRNRTTHMDRDAVMAWTRKMQNSHPPASYEIRPRLVCGRMAATALSPFMHLTVTNVVLAPRGRLGCSVLGLMLVCLLPHVLALARVFHSPCP